MADRKFVTKLESAMMPNQEGSGRTLRIVIEVDMNAVRDYVMFDGKGSDMPWTGKVIEEMLGALAEIARHESIVHAMLARR